MRASPVGHPPRRRHSSRSSGPAARWIAPSTPPPPRRDSLAALTIASTARRVMSALTASRTAKFHHDVELTFRHRLNRQPIPLADDAHLFESFRDFQRIQRNDRGKSLHEPDVDHVPDRVVGGCLRIEILVTLLRRELVR